MKTDCRQPEFEFQGLDSRKVCARFDGGQLTSDAGALLLREVNLQTNLLSRFAECFSDSRDQRYVCHDIEHLVTQRTMAICLGYEDVNDHDELRRDPLMALASGRTGMDMPAGKSTIQRMEQPGADAGGKARYHKVTCNDEAVDNLLIDHFLESHPEPPREIILDADATDSPIYGDQEQAFFHGYYGHYCYLPLYITCDDFILCARLRPSNIDACAGWEHELPRIIARIRQCWPKTRIIVRGDSGFCRDALLSWCEANNVFYVIGLAKNDRLKAEIKEHRAEAKTIFEQTGQAARVFADFTYKTLSSWRHARRVVGKAEHLPKGENPRFIVTNLSIQDHAAADLYEKVYCARGDMENRIKEQQADMFADRMSARLTRANQLRLYFSTIAYTLMAALRRVALAGTSLEKAQAGMIRLKLLKIGARITISVRRVYLSMSSGYPLQELFAKALARIRASPPAATC